MPYVKVAEHKAHLVIGAKQTLKAMNKGEVSEVFIADDADKQITQKVASLAGELEIPCQHVDSMRKLGKAAGVAVATSTIAFKR